MLSPAEIIKDPLSEVTRRERRILLGTCAIAITMVKTGLVPSKISALGIDFSPADQRSLLGIIALVVAYFLAAFLIYAVSDFVFWRQAYHEAIKKRLAELYDAQGRSEEPDVRDRAVFDEMERREFRSIRWAIISQPVSLLRAAFDFAFPIVLGIYTIGVLVLAKSPAGAPIKGMQLTPPGAAQLMLSRSANRFEVLEHRGSIKTWAHFTQAVRSRTT